MKELLFGGARLNSTSRGFRLVRACGRSRGRRWRWRMGLGKLPPSDGFMNGVTRLACRRKRRGSRGFAEFFCGLLIAIGLGTRPAALIVATNMSVAAFRQHANDPYLRAELAYLYLAVAMMFVLVGAGRFSIDRVIKR